MPKVPFRTSIQKAIHGILRRSVDKDSIESLPLLIAVFRLDLSHILRLHLGSKCKLDSSCLRVAHTLVIDQLIST